MAVRKTKKDQLLNVGLKKNGLMYVRVNLVEELKVKKEECLIVDQVKEFLVKRLKQPQKCLHLKKEKKQQKRKDWVNQQENQEELNQYEEKNEIKRFRRFNRKSNESNWY